MATTRRWLHFVKRRPDAESNLRAISFPNTPTGPRQQTFQKYIDEMQKLNQEFWAANNRDFEDNVQRITREDTTHQPEKLNNALARYYTQRLNIKRKEFADFQRASYKRNIQASKLGILAFWERLIKG